MYPAKRVIAAGRTSVSEVQRKPKIKAQQRGQQWNRTLH